MAASPGDPTRLLRRLADGDVDAGEELAPLVYDRLRQLAAKTLARGGDHAGFLQPTILVHEAWMQLATPATEGRDRDWQDRSHFFAVAAQAMRHLLVDQRRREAAAKRGGDGDWQRVTAAGLSDERQLVDLDVLDLNAALEKLAEVDERAARIIEMRFFAGMTGEEIAAALGISRQTVVREITAARAWLARELDRGD